MNWAQIIAYELFQSELYAGCCNMFILCCSSFFRSSLWFDVQISATSLSKIYISIYIYIYIYIYFYTPSVSLNYTIAQYC